MKYLFTLVFLSFTAVGFSQVTDKTASTTQVGLLYEKELSFGFRLHTAGWGIFGTYGKAHSYSKSKFYQFEFVEIKHPKERKISNDYARSHRYTPKPFIFGKQNNFYALHAGYGEKIFLGDKAEKSGVEVNFTWMAGPSLGLLKPYYLDVIIKQESTNDGILIEYTQQTYDPDDPDSRFLKSESILGSSGFKQGLNEIRFVPGVHGKAGFNFDWANFNEFVKALEVGIAADVYPKRVPIMVEEHNSPYFLYLYLSVQFGKKW